MKTEKEKAVWLDELDISQMTCGWGTPRANRTVLEKPLVMRGNTFMRGVGTHADSELEIRLNGCATRFIATVGIDDEVLEKGHGRFEVWVDGRKVSDSGVLTSLDVPLEICVDLNGAAGMKLVTSDPVNETHYSHTDWADARIEISGAAEGLPEVPARVIRIVPPPDLRFSHDRALRINNPRITGVTPGHPFLFRVPVSCQGECIIEAQGLPDGLRIDSSTGIISGVVKQAGRFVTSISVRAGKEECHGEIIIEAGNEKLARTPPMGWNSWNAWGVAVDDAKVRDAADAFIETGLAAHGYQYINIDDGWEGVRAPDGTILCNEKFPDMKALGDYIHSLGLKFGIYSSPGPLTCGKYTGSYQHELQDALTYARWGVDFLKYDWCSYQQIAASHDLHELQKPYYVMRDALKQCDRDIVYSLCQYGWGKVSEWGRKTGGQLWRTTGDITDTWNSMRSIGFRQHDNWPYAGPGGWNDPDMLVLGHVGWGPRTHYTNLTKHEQLTHMSLWCMLSAPLLIGCDLSRLDEWTLAILCNDEVIAVDQDPLGRQAVRVVRNGTREIWAKTLHDGSMVAGLFNLDSGAQLIDISWEQLGITGSYRLRDLWRHDDLGIFTRRFEADVAGHGVMLVQLTQV